MAELRYLMDSDFHSFQFASFRIQYAADRRETPDRIIAGTPHITKENNRWHHWVFIWLCGGPLSSNRSIQNHMHWKKMIDFYGSRDGLPSTIKLTRPTDSVPMSWSAILKLKTSTANVLVGAGQTCVLDPLLPHHLHSACPTQTFSFTCLNI